MLKPTNYRITLPWCISCHQLLSNAKSRPVFFVRWVFELSLQIVAAVTRSRCKCNLTYQWMNHVKQKLVKKAKLRQSCRHCSLIHHLIAAMHLYLIISYLHVSIFLVTHWYFTNWRQPWNDYNWRLLAESPSWFQVELY